MSDAQNIMEERVRAKAAFRRRDAVRLRNGEDPKIQQRENAVFPADLIRRAKFSNLAKALGR